MRLNRYMNEEDSALDIEEPEVGGEYSDRVVKDNIKKIEKAISKIGDPKDEGEEAILSDLEDKLDKWKNVDKETKSIGPTPVPDMISAKGAAEPAAAPVKKEKK